MEAWLPAAVFTWAKTSPMPKSWSKVARQDVPSKGRGWCSFRWRFWAGTWGACRRDARFAQPDESVLRVEWVLEPKNNQFQSSLDLQWPFTFAFCLGKLTRQRHRLHET